MQFPDFILIGAAKSGTTALFYYLSQHPDVFACPVREPNFFALEGAALDFAGPGDEETVGRHSVTERDAYEALYADAQDGKITGEVSPLYLYHPKAAANIAAHRTDCKLIVVLRDPVARAYASYLHLRRDGREPCTSFEEALTMEAQRQNWEHLWHYDAMGRYAEQLGRYLEHFPREQLLFLLHEDLRTSPAATLDACFNFLGIRPDFEPDFSRRPNRSGIPRFQALQNFMKGQGALKRFLVRVLPEQIRGRLVSGVQHINLAQPVISETTAQKLRAGYREDIQRLQDLIGRDLSDWLTD